jgi:chromosome segregation ATPase
MIEERVRMWEQRQQQMRVADELKEKLTGVQKELDATAAAISQTEKDIENTDAEIARVKEEIELASMQRQAEAEMLKSAEASERRQKEIAKTEIRKRQIELSNLLYKNKSAEEKLAELQRMRRLLEQDLSDMDHREKPEVKKLSAEVKASQGQLDHSKQRLEAVKAQVVQKRREFEELKNSQSVAQFRDLTVERNKLERRQAKWKAFLKNSGETLQSLEFFSLANNARRAELSQQLQSCEREHLETLHEIRELESYSDLLAALIAENLSTTSKTRAA